MRLFITDRSRSRTLFENLVYLELLRRGYIVDIGKNREKEIDFVAKDLSGKRYYIQVSYTIQDEAVKEREGSARCVCCVRDIRIF
jgi:hypothetical protein